MIGLETALAVTLTELVRPGVLTLSEAIAALSTKPARSRDIGDHGGPIEPGAPANLVVFDPEAGWTVEASQSHSLSRNTPFAARQLWGRVRHTLLRGQFTFRDGQAVHAPAGEARGHLS
jgi:dihydroorotase